MRGRMHDKLILVTETDKTGNISPYSLQNSHPKGHLI